MYTVSNSYSTYFFNSVAFDVSTYLHTIFSLEFYSTLLLLCNCNNIGEIKKNYYCVQLILGFYIYVWIVPILYGVLLYAWCIYYSSPMAHSYLKLLNQPAVLMFKLCIVAIVLNTCYAVKFFFQQLKTQI